MLEDGWLFFIQLYRFLQRGPSVELSASSYFCFSDNLFCRQLIRAEILRRVVAMALSVSLLARSRFFFNFLFRSYHRSQKNTVALSTSSFFCQDFFDPGNRSYRLEAARTRACYRHISDYLDYVAQRVSPRYAFTVAVLMPAFNSTVAIWALLLYAALLRASSFSTIAMFRTTAS